MTKAEPIRVLSVCGSLQARSFNRSALDVVQAALPDDRATVDVYDGLRAIPPFDPDLGDVAGGAVDDWRARIEAADVVLLASPEYAGSLAGVVKNTLDWIVGSGELSVRPVALISVGTTGGVHARAALVRTLTWQGAHVVASVGIDAPRTKTGPDGAFTDPPTLTMLSDLAALVLRTPDMDAGERLDRVHVVLAEAGVGPEHVAPLG